MKKSYKDHLWEIVSGLLSLATVWQLTPQPLLTHTITKLADTCLMLTVSLLGSYPMSLSLRIIYFVKYKNKKKCQSYHRQESCQAAPHIPAASRWRCSSGTGTWAQLGQAHWRTYKNKAGQWWACLWESDLCLLLHEQYCTSTLHIHAFASKIHSFTVIRNNIKFATFLIFQ